jgi:NADH-quinone oxidoreductase subunit G
MSRIAEKLGGGRARLSAAAVMQEISQQVAAFAGASYAELKKVVKQYPLIGREDVYYGGTAYDNKGGLGVQIPTASDNGEAIAASPVSADGQPTPKRGDVLVVPAVRLYNRERTFQPSEAALMSARIPAPYVEMSSADAGPMGIADGDMVQVQVGDAALRVRAHVNGGAPAGSVVLPRHLEPGVAAPLTVSVGQVTRVEE